MPASSIFPPGVQRKAFFWSRGELNALADLDPDLLPEGLAELVEQHTSLYFRWLGSKQSEKTAHDQIHHAEEHDRQARAEAIRKRKTPPAPTIDEARAKAKAATELREDLGLAGAKIEESIIELISGNAEWAKTILARLDEQEKAVAAALDLINDTITARGRLRWALDLAEGRRELDRHQPIDMPADATMLAIRGALAEAEVNLDKAIEQLPLR